MAKTKKIKRTIAPKKSKIRIAVVTARFNEEITYKLEEGALSYLEQLNDDGFSIEIASLRVPGAVEIPLACQKLFELGFDGVVTCGAVIRGETSHYDSVCNSVTDGLTRLMLDYGKPIGFGVLTTENDEQAMDRSGGKHGNKGQEAAQVVVEMVGLLRDLEKSH